MMRSFGRVSCFNGRLLDLFLLLLLLLQLGADLLQWQETCRLQQNCLVVYFFMDSLFLAFPFEEKVIIVTLYGTLGLSKLRHLLPSEEV